MFCPLYLLMAIESVSHMVLLGSAVHAHAHGFMLHLVRAVFALAGKASFCSRKFWAQVLLCCDDKDMAVTNPSPCVNCFP
jgi:hypothetical protein